MAVAVQFVAESVRMKISIQKAVVLGAGTMGARIAAHFANAGLPCVLLDIVPPDFKPGAPAAERNRFARNGIEAAKKSRPAAFFSASLADETPSPPTATKAAKKSRPAAFFSASLADKIAIGNFEDDLARCAEA